MKKRGKIDMKTYKQIKLGRLAAVENKNKHMMANKSYFLAYLQGEVEPPVAYLFTNSQLAEARERATKNPEDCLPLAKWWRMW